MGSVKGSLPPEQVDAADRAPGAVANGWRSHFPYRWDADELVSRREMLQFAVYTSGTLFLGTALLALVRLFRRKPSPGELQIASVASVSPGQALYFHYPQPDDQAVLVRLEDGRFVAYNQTCTHLSCSVFYQEKQKRLFCPCHEGVFDVRTGEPVAGPPVRPLSRIDLRSDGEHLYAIGMQP